MQPSSDNGVLKFEDDDNSDDGEDDKDSEYDVSERKPKGATKAVLSRMRQSPNLLILQQTQRNK